MSLSSISDDAVLRATGRTWREWFGLLEASGLAARTSGEMLAFLREKHGLPGWWQRAIAEGFEQNIGRCVKGGSDDDAYTIVVRALPFPAPVLHEWWADEPRRAQWLRRGDFEVVEAHPPAALIGFWKPDQSQLEILIEPAEEGGAVLTIRHRELPRAEFLPRHREFWARSLDRLAERLSGDS